MDDGAEDFYSPCLSLCNYLSNSNSSISQLLIVYGKINCRKAIEFCTLRIHQNTYSFSSSLTVAVARAERCNHLMA